MLNFPNQSRVFDPTRRAVRFWGHDSAMEWSFFVTEDALPSDWEPFRAINRAITESRDAANALVDLYLQGADIV